MVKDYFFHPNHVGVVDLTQPLSVHCRGIQKGQSVLVDLYLQCTQDKRIKRACFRSSGNPYIIAALEYLCRLIEGVALDKLPSMNYQLLIRELEIPTTQYPVAVHIEDIYKEILALMNKKFEEYMS